MKGLLVEHVKEFLQVSQLKSAEKLEPVKSLVETPMELLKMTLRGLRPMHLVRNHVMPLSWWLGCIYPKQMQNTDSITSKQYQEGKLSIENIAK